MKDTMALQNFTISALSINLYMGVHNNHLSHKLSREFSLFVENNL